jgi:hypothetical protein
MMADFHLWHPAYIPLSRPTLECFITLGESIFLSRGTGAWVRRALEALGISTPPAMWQLQAMRTHYFSSYRGVTGDWEDDWALAWRLRVTFPDGAMPPLPRPPTWGYFDLDAADTTFNPLDPPAQWEGWPGLLLADAQTPAAIEEFDALVRGQLPEAACVRSEAFSRYPQLRCDLGFRHRSFFERGAQEFEALLQQLVDAGAFIRFDHSSGNTGAQ